MSEIDLTHQRRTQYSGTTDSEVNREPAAPVSERGTAEKGFY